MAVSISDVARRAGVSQGTVSHVMNGNERAGIAIATQERVRKAAMELGYQPNRMARMLGRGRTDTLGLFISQLQNPFFIQIMEAAERLALESGYHVLMDAAPTDQDLAHHKARLRGWPMDGVLMHAEPHQTIDTYLGAQAENLPVVYMGGQPRLDTSDTVFFNVYAGARMAMQYLIDRGYRNIAYVFPYQWIIDKPREPRHRAYREVCEESGIEPRLIRMEKQEESRLAGLIVGMSIARMPSAERPDALLCFNDVVAEGVLFGLRREGCASRTTSPSSASTGAKTRRRWTYRSPRCGWTWKSYVARHFVCYCIASRRGRRSRHRSSRFRRGYSSGAPRRIRPGAVI
jgi:LacI family transcriptional regulator